MLVTQWEKAGDQRVTIWLAKHNWLEGPEPDRITVVDFDVIPTSHHSGEFLGEYLANKLNSMAGFLEPSVAASRPEGFRPGDLLMLDRPGSQSQWTVVLCAERQSKTLARLWKGLGVYYKNGLTWLPCRVRREAPG